MVEKISRRSFLKLVGATGGAVILAGCTEGDGGSRGFLDRLRGIPMTQLPMIEGAWEYIEGVLILEMTKLPELEELGGAVRIEGETLTEPILVVLGEDGNYYAFKNACTHAGRKIDPVAGTMTLECCSVSGSTYDYQGSVLSGPANGSLTSYPLELADGKLKISLD